MCPTGCSPGDTMQDNNNRVWIYEGTGIDAPTTTLPTSTNMIATACCGPAGCPDPAASNGSAANVCGCSGNDPSDTSCCVYQQPGYTECINCCCKSRLQARRADLDLTPDDVAENINPTVDALSKLITLSEQRRRDVSRDVSAEPTPAGGEEDTPYTDFSIAPPETASPLSQVAQLGPCDGSHYTNWPTQGHGDGFFDPTPPAGGVDPATGICPCENSDPNNPFQMITLTTTGNPSPQTLDANGYAVGSSDPCP